MQQNSFLALVLLPLLFNQIFGYDKVVSLTHTTFEKTITSPFHDIWLVKFYAPWCDHCKKLAPVLQDISKVLNETMAIGKIDCTKEEDLCRQFDIDSYPTLKWYRDGEFHDYVGGRDHDSFLSFAEKMNKPAVASFSSYQEASNHLFETSSNGVAFLAITTPEVLPNEGMDTLNQMAREFQSVSSFGLLENPKKEELPVSITVRSDTMTKTKPILVKLEMGVDPMIFMGEWKASSISSFIREHVEGSVPEITAANINELGHRGKYLAIAILNTENEHKSRDFLSKLRRYASSAPSYIEREFQFAWMKGNEWKPFLSKFSIVPTNQTQFFALEYEYDIFWTNPSPISSPEDVDQFLKDILSNKILSVNLNTGAVVKDPLPMGLTHETVDSLTNSPLAMVFYFLVLAFGIVGMLPPSNPFNLFLEKYFFGKCIDPLLERLLVSGPVESEESKKTK